MRGETDGLKHTDVFGTIFGFHIKLSLTKRERGDRTSYSSRSRVHVEKAPLCRGGGRRGCQAHYVRLSNC